MGVLTKIGERLGFKRLENIIHSGHPNFFWRATAPTTKQMQTDVGTGIGANVIMSPIGWMQRNAIEAPPAMRKKSDGEQLESHDLLDLLANPNPHYSGAHLIIATIFSWATAGNAYWLIQSSVAGKPKELWYTPHWLIEPKWPQDGSRFISHYNYMPGGKPMRIEIEDVVHFRQGINPENTRLGLSTLFALLAEVWTDMESSTFVATIMKNGGVPGLLLSPRGDAAAMSPEDVEEMTNDLETQFAGAQRGRPLVTSKDVRLESFGFDPKSLDLRVVRNQAEERVCAALGIPAAVVGFGTGMQQTKVGRTLTELRQEAWQGGILPMLKGFASEINRQLLPLFLRSDGLELFFDASAVPALSEDRDKFEKRAKERLDSGAITVNEYRTLIGLEEVADGDIYLRKFSTIEVPAGTSGRTIESEDGDSGEKAHGDDDHTALEREVATNGRRIKRPPAALTALAGRIDAIRKQSSTPFQDRLESFFERLGKDAEASTTRLFRKDRDGIESLVINFGNGIDIKQSEADLADQIVAGMEMEDVLPIFEELFQKTFLSVANDTAAAMKGTIGLVTGVPDPVARAVLAAAGRRAGLIDLTRQTKKAVFDTLVQGAAEGLGPKAIARRIRDAAGAGPRFSAGADEFRRLLSGRTSGAPLKEALSRTLRDRRFDATLRQAWTTNTPLSKVQIEKMTQGYSRKALRARSEMIARTETAFSTNVSSLELGKSIGATEALIFDARAGATDAICEALNQRVASLEDARGLMFDEHPNGTRSFTPIPPTMEL